MDKLTDESQKEYQEIIRRQGTLSDTLEYLTSTIAEYTETSTALHGPCTACEIWPRISIKPCSSWTM